MIIYVNKDDLRSFGYSPSLWNGNVIKVEVPDYFVGGNKTYEPVLKRWVNNAVYELTEDDLKERYELERYSIIENSMKVISLPQTKLMMGMLTDEEKDSLREWIEYIDLVKQTVYPDPLPTKE